MLKEFYDVYISGHLREAFIEKYAVAPQREIGVPQRISHVATGQELLEIIRKYNRGREVRPVYASLATTDGANYKALDRVCIDVDAPPEKLEDVKKTLRATARKMGDYLWVEFTGRKGFRVCVFLQQLIEINDLARKFLAGYQVWLTEKLKIMQYVDRAVIGDVRRLFRVPFTLHQEEPRKQAVPLDPASFEPVGATEALTLFTERKTLWLGLRALAYADDSVVVEKHRGARWRGQARRGGELCLKNYEVGAVCGPRELAGYGWIKYIVDNGIYLADARHTIVWTALGVAVSAGLVDAEKAESWLKAALEKYPDPEGEPPESYIKTLKYYANYRARHAVNPPTWATLVTWKTKEGADVAPWTRHLAINILYALWKAGVIRVERADVLEQLFKDELNYTPLKNF